MYIITIYYNIISNMIRYNTGYNYIYIYIMIHHEV